MSDDEFDRAINALRALAEAHETMRLEASWIASPLSGDASYPMPGECHPAFTDKAAWLQEWLNRRDDSYLVLPIPIPRRSRWIDPAEIYPPATNPTTTLTRRRCAGRAPYVGRPFVYLWDVAVDEYGRAVAGDARIEYTSERPEWAVSP